MRVDEYLLVGHAGQRPENCGSLQVRNHGSIDANFDASWLARQGIFNQIAEREPVILADRKGRYIRSVRPHAIEIGAEVTWLVVDQYDRCSALVFGTFRAALGECGIN